MIELFTMPETWAVLALIATFIPGPQTRILPAILRGIGSYMKKRSKGTK